MFKPVQLFACKTRLGTAEPQLKCRPSQNGPVLFGVRLEAAPGGSSSLRFDHNTETCDQFGLGIDSLCFPCPSFTLAQSQRTRSATPCPFLPHVVLVRVLAKRKRPEAATAPREVLPGAEGQEGAALGARLLGGATGVKRFGVKRVSLWAMVKKQIPFLGVGMVMNLIFCGVGVRAM